MRKIIDSVFRNIVVWFSLILVSFLAVVSFLFTSVFEWDESNQYLPEVIHYKSDIFIITLVVCVFIIFLLYRTKYLERISLISMKIFLIISVLVLSLGWIFLTRPVPVADDMMVSNAAVQFLNNDYSMLQKGGYVYQYVHQLGIIWLLEQIYRLFGAGNYLVYQMLNVLTLCVVYGCLLKLSKKFSKQRRQSELQWLCCLCFVFRFFIQHLYMEI